MPIRASRVAACTMTVVLVTSALAGAAAGTTAAQASAAPQAPTAPERLLGDFNGDGHRDVATGAPVATVGGKAAAGQVAVAYGSANGLTAKTSAISQNSPGVAGTAEAEDGFGETIHAGDFNADGYTDLAVGAAGEDVARSGGNDKDGGSVQILWGSPSGLAGGTDVPDPAPTAHDKYGQSLAAGDFDGDGTTDLAIGSTSQQVWIHKGGFTRQGGTGGRYTFTPSIWGDQAGAFALTSGDVNGDQAAELLVNGLDGTEDTNVNVLFLGSPSGPTSPTKLPGGLAAAIGDFDGDSYGDIAIGNHWDKAEGTPDSVNGGRVTIRYGGPEGIAANRPAAHIDQQTAGVPGSSETDDAFGASLSAGDIDQDGRADLAVGIPEESIGEQGWGTGSVIVLKGSASGLNGAGARTISQGTAGVPGANEPFDTFGRAVLLSDVTGDGHSDLTVGAPGENEEAGALWNLRGSAAGVITTGSVNLTPKKLGIAAGPSQMGSVLTG